MQYTTYRIMPCVALSEGIVTYKVADSPEHLHDYWHDIIAKEPDHDPGVETLAVIILDSRLRARSWHRVSTGMLTETSAHPREILRPVILQSGYAFAVLHNHPSGDPTPSAADIRFTKKMKEAADIMQLRMVDHIITTTRTPNGIGTDPYYSFREGGII